MQKELLKSIILQIKQDSKHESINSSLVHIISHIASVPSLMEAVNRQEISTYLDLIAKSKSCKDKQVTKFLFILVTLLVF